MRAMDWKSSAGKFKTVHLAVDWHHSESPPCGRSAVEWSVRVARCCKHTQGIRKRKPRRRSREPTSGFSGVGERSGGKGRKRTHREDPGRSRRLGAENETVRKCLALLGILRDRGRATIALASTTRELNFREKKD